MTTVANVTEASATNSEGQGHKFGKKSTFSECGHVAYQIKGNETYNKQIFWPYKLVLVD